MRALGHEAWAHQTVGEVERGKRRLTAEEILGLALALDTTIATLMAPTNQDRSVDLPGGSIDVESVQALAMGYNTEPVRWEDDKPVYAVAETSREIRDQMPWRYYDKRAEQAGRQQELEEAARSGAWDVGESAAPESPLVVAAIVTSDLGVMVGRRVDGKPPWTFIAGEIEPGESPADAAVREVKEETGLEIEVTDRLGRRKHPKTGRMMIYLAGRPVRGTDVFVGDSRELAEVRWLSLGEAIELMPGMHGPARVYLEHELGGES
jgi:8-oxo-dGTP pyrophosphatase MutT (NUDIX family)